MVLLELRFLAGRFHATPWGRNVNEGVPEWPPSPYRIARALIDAGKRRRPEWSDERLASVVEVVSAPVEYVLPPVTESHTRSYLSSNKKDTSNKQKIFDAFVALDRGDSVLVAFDSAPSAEVIGDLRKLVGEMSYLGRSESWVSMDVLDSELGEANCHPTAKGPVKGATKVVDVACLRPPSEYDDLAVKPSKGTTKKPIPLSWIEALSMGTKDLFKDGWSGPPAQVMIPYHVPIAARPRLSGTLGKQHGRLTCARYALSSSVLPRVVDTIAFSERVRRKLMGIHKKIMGDDPTLVSRSFSGKVRDGSPLGGHDHAFYLPLDEDGDGRLDTLLVWANAGFDTSEQQALDGLRSVWQEGGRPDVRLVLMSITEEPVTPTSTTWVSETPFVTNRHHRKGRGPYGAWIAEEVARECELKGLPRPVSITPVDRTRGSGHQYRWMEFLRSRKGSRPLRGHGFVLTFDEPVKGPIVVGSLAHYGLGRFEPAAR